MLALTADVRYALRMFARNPGTTAVAVLSLAIAIGPNSALFSLIDHLLFRSATGGVAGVYHVSVLSGKRLEGISYPDYLDYQQQSKVPAGIVAYETRGALWATGGQQEIIPIQIVTENYFSTLGVKAALGRALAPGFDRHLTGAPPVMISHSLWQRRMAADPDIIGKTMLLNGRGFSIVGVAQPEFRGLETLIPFDLWVPFSAMPVLMPGEEAALARRDCYGIAVVALLRPGTSQAAAEAELSGVASRLAQAYPATNKGTAVTLRSNEGDRTKFGVFGLIVMSLVGMVLLIACANVAGILLAQGEARRREIAVRLALGAGRAQLIRLLLVESTLISMAAAGVGLLLGSWLVELAAAIRPAFIMSMHYETGIDGRVMGYTLLLALATTFAFGLAPALRASRPDLLPALRGDSARGGTRIVSFRGLLVIGQVAVAQFLLLGAGLLLRSYLEAAAIRPGFDTGRNLLLVWVVGDIANKKPASLADLAGTVRALPGVRQVSFSRSLPLGVSGNGKIPVSVPGVTDEPVPVGRNTVGPGFCSVMGTRILRGREFEARDPRTVALVNQTMARQFWGGPDAAMGRFFRMENADVQVIGVVEDGKYGSLTEPAMPHMYVPAPPMAGEGYILIESAMNAGNLAATVRKTILAASPGLSIGSLTTLRQHLRLPLFAWEAGAGLVSVVGLLGIFLGGVGLYGMVSYSVTRRVHEIGVRMALGAQPRDVLGLVARQALWLVGVGSAVGIAIALTVARVISAVFYNVSPADPLAIAGSVVVVAAIALLATQVPARRALRVDPISVLRQE